MRRGIYAPMEAHERAEAFRDAARILLKRADRLDGQMRCECGHTRQGHDPAGWNEGWCDVDGCKCEQFTPW